MEKGGGVEVRELSTQNFIIKLLEWQAISTC